MNPPQPGPAAKELSQLQRWFQTVVTHAEGVESGLGTEEAQRLIQLAPGDLELVRLEWAIYEVFDGPGVEGQAALSADQLLSIPADRWDQARLAPVVCLQLLDTQFPVNEYYTALRRTKSGEAVPFPAARESFV